MSMNFALAVGEVGERKREAQEGHEDRNRSSQNRPSFCCAFREHGNKHGEQREKEVLLSTSRQSGVSDVGSKWGVFA